MKTVCGALMTFLLAVVPAGAVAGITLPDAGSEVPQSARAPASTSQANESSVILPCIPVAAYWTGPPQSEGMPQGPELAIVDTDVRPKDARVHLDDRFVGRARYLDGKPGYLYLAPGVYRLELRLEGYETVVIDLVAEAGCRFDLKHRLTRIKGTPKEQKSENYGEGRPFNRVFAPLQTAESNVGPDHSLRPDIGSDAATPATAAEGGAALRFRVTPSPASISIDGVFVATAREVMRMEGPLAVASGRHRVEVSAPGYRTAIQNIELEESEVLEITVDLEHVAGESP